MLNALKQLGKCICYAALYYIMQLLAMFVVAMGYTIRLYVELGSRGIDLLEMDRSLIELRIVEVLYSRLSVIIVVAGIMTLFTLWLFFKLRKKKLTREANLKTFEKKHWPAIFIGAAGLCLVVNFGMQLIPIPEDVMMDYIESSQTLVEGPFIWLFLANVVMAPLVEEILFRGLILDRMRRVMPVGWALVLSSVFFGLMHGQIIWICYTALVGLVLGLVAWKTGSTWAPMFMHFVFNLFGTTIGYFVEEVTVVTCLICGLIGIVCLIVCVGLMLRSGKKSDLQNV